MSENNAKISISFKEGTFEISGSELFVTQHITTFKDLIYSAFQEFRSPNLEEAIGNTNTPSSNDTSSLENLNKSNQYPNVLHIEDNKVKVLQRLPGNNISQKAINTALVYLWGYKSLGVDSVPFTDIRELCREHSCLDSSNFSYQMNSARKFFIVEGHKRSSLKTCKLTLPGLERAKELLDTLNGK